jgi:DNA-binding GntR family transcriptional regulator
MPPSKHSAAAPVDAGARVRAVKSGVRPADARQTGGRLVYEALRRAIMSLELSPGTGLEEGQLCRQFNVSRTPVREALIRLAGEGLAELAPNRGARVASMQFADVVDHYEAMDIFQPIACHFAAVRRSLEELRHIQETLALFRDAVAQEDHGQMVNQNYELHSAIATACHNRCIERGYRQMLTDKLRLAQHGLSGTSHGRGRALADRFAGNARICERLVKAIEKGDGLAAERLARELNAYIRSQVMDLMSASLAAAIPLPQPAPRAGHDTISKNSGPAKGRNTKKRQ